MKIDIVHCVSAEIPYLGQIIFLRCGRKSSQPVIAGFLNQLFLYKLTIFCMLIQIHEK